jgi:hypothetical protein
MVSNEVPGCDDNTDGVERRLDLIDFVRNNVPAVDSKYRNQDPIIKGLQEDFNTEEYEAAFLDYIIKTFNNNGFKIETPKAVINASKDYIK